MRLTRVGLAVVAVTASLLTAAPPAAVAGAGPVSSTPAAWTPSLATSGTDGTVEQVRQLVPCGGVMFAVGTFTQIKQNGVTYNRNNVFAFSATTGAMSGWNPNVTGVINDTIVNSIALSANCQTAYLGGKFTAVNGTPARNVASVSVATGRVNTGWRNSANGQVSALLVSGNHVLAGGYFTSINNSPRGYLASLNPSTGIDDGYVNLNISGSYSYTDDGGLTSAENPTRVYNFALNPVRNRLLATGVFTSVGGQARRQIFMLSLNATNTTVHPWYSLEFNQNCAVSQPFWLQDASWAPDGSKIYIATNGYKPANGPGYVTTDPRAGLCDVAAAFPTSPGLVTRLWVNYTGCDSLYSTAADSNTVYVGGHQRWMSTPNGCDGVGTVGPAAPGMAGLSPTNGALTFNPTRGRGYGATDMLVTPAGLWIASDNFEGAQQCGGVDGHAGICFLPNRVEPKADYNADGRADHVIWRPSTGAWWIRGSSPRVFGRSGDVPLAGDFTGDAKSDLAVYRPSTGQWHISGLSTVNFGNSTDRPVAADYTNNGKADIAIWRPSNGTWYVRGYAPVSFGRSTDIPVPADFTGDGRADVAVFRPSNGTWYVRGQSAVAFGLAGDRPTVADFTGDGKADIALWRPSTGRWYVRGVTSVVYGVGSDIPVAGDFTGDGRAEIAVWRRSDGKWYIRGVSANAWGVSGDVPLYG